MRKTSFPLFVRCRAAVSMCVLSGQPKKGAGGLSSSEFAKRWGTFSRALGREACARNCEPVKIGKRFAEVDTVLCVSVSVPVCVRACACN